MVLEILINWIIPTLCTFLCGFIVKEFKKQKIYYDTMKISMLSLIRNSIVNTCSYYIEKGYIDDYGRHAITELSSSYKNLKGNHGIEILINQTLNLKNRKDL